MKVYLAGGLYSDWQDEVKQTPTLDGVEWIDPRNQDIHNPHHFTPMAEAGLRAADVVFAYLEENNTGGYDLSYEIGYARALGKPVILVLEAPRHYFRMPKAAAAAVFDTLETGIWYLENLYQMIEGN